MNNISTNRTGEVTSALTPPLLPSLPLGR